MPSIPHNATRRRAFALAANIGALGLGHAWLAAFAHAAQAHGTKPGATAGVFAPPRGTALGGEFALADQHGRAFRLGAGDGRATLVFFGFTGCASVCPTALAEGREVIRVLGPGRAPRVVFVTLDPERDTPAVLKAYVEAFDPGFVALTAPRPAIDAVAAAYRISARRVDTPGGYTIDHSAFTYLLDESGRVARLYGHGTAARVIAADIARTFAQSARGR